jgi:hypothetical protein
LAGWKNITVTIEEFRTLALSLPDATEGAHMGHPDFRVGGKIFATLAYQDKGWGMVKLKPDQQAVLVQAEPTVFMPVEGGWGRQGATNVCLKPATSASVRDALEMAWRNVAPKTLAKKRGLQVDVRRCGRRLAADL